MAKAPDAFRTISEVSDALHTPAHVLRFWESKFSQIKPVKRAGGRRYYRPDDIALLAGIKHLLHEQGMTIKGAQKLLREKGVKHVAGLIGSPIEAAAQAKTPDPIQVSSEPGPISQGPTDASKTETVVQTGAKDPLDLTAFTPVETAEDVGPRWFDNSIKLDQEAVSENSTKIAQLIEELTTIRDRMRAS